MQDSYRKLKKYVNIRWGIATTTGDTEAKLKIGGATEVAQKSWRY